MSEKSPSKVSILDLPSPLELALVECRELRIERDQLRARVEELEQATDKIETAAMSALRDGGCDVDDLLGLESACESVCELVKGVQS